MRVAIIPARGGSKRIPRKNVRSFYGRPIIEHPISAALRSGVFDEVMVSTDDAEIKEAALSAGAVVPFMRSTETASDFATTADVIAEVLTKYAEHGKVPDELCCIYPIAVFVTPDILRESFSILQSQGVDAVASVVAYGHPVQRSFLIREGMLAYSMPEYARYRTQDLPQSFHDAAQFYWIRSEAFFSAHSLIPTKTAPFILKESKVQDIDTEEDWRLAEIKYSLMVESQAKS